MPVTTHFDEMEVSEADLGTIGGRWRGVSAAAGSVRLGVSRIEVPPGRAATPVHAEDEEVFHVLAGSGFSHQEDGTFAIRAGDTIFYSAWRPAHTVIAGDEGLDVLAFGTRGPYGGIRFPRLGAVKVLDRIVRGDRTHQFRLEADLGPVELPAQPDPRPATIVNLDERPPRDFGRARAWMLSRLLGAQGIAFNRVDLDAGAQAAPLHCHSMEEELFVVLAGDGVLLVGSEEAEHPLRAGSVFCRLPGTGEPHAMRAGDGGMTVLAFSDKHPNDMCFYPRSGKVTIRGLGITFRPEIVPWGDD
jgi:uncharacterized cupin superfamily protein